MSLLELVGSILTELEKVQQKLDRLLASGGEKARSLKVALQGVGKHLNESGGVVGSDPTEPSKLPEVKKENIPTTKKYDFALPKTGKYQWYVLKNDDKVKLRRCSNEGCPMFLKFNEDKKKYEHWKYDVNTGVGGYVQDTCDYYEVGG